MSNQWENKPFFYIYHALTYPNFVYSLESFLPPFSGLQMPTSFSNSSSGYEIPNQKAQENYSTTHIFEPNVIVDQNQQPIAQNEERVTYRKQKNRRMRDSFKELQSAKKNSESNIVNQLFSFFTSYEKSESIVQRAIRLLRKDGADIQKIKSIFYNIVRLINFKRGRKYVNRENILKYYTPEVFLKQIPEINEKLGGIKLLDLEELCRLFRAITAHFIKFISINALLTSKRITNIAKRQHLKRRRRVLSSLQNKSE